MNSVRLDTRILGALGVPDMTCNEPPFPKVRDHLKYHPMLHDFVVLYEHPQNLLLVVSARGEIVMMSPNSAALLGFPSASLSDTYLASLVHPLDYFALENLITADLNLSHGGFARGRTSAPSAQGNGSGSFFKVLDQNLKQLVPVSIRLVAGLGSYRTFKTVAWSTCLDMVDLTFLVLKTTQSPEAELSFEEDPLSFSVLLKSDLTVVHVSPNAYPLTGFTPDELTNRSMHHLCFPFDISNVHDRETTGILTRNKRTFIKSLIPYVAQFSTIPIPHHENLFWGIIKVQTGPFVFPPLQAHLGSSVATTSTAAASIGNSMFHGQMPSSASSYMPQLDAPFSGFRAPLSSAETFPDYDDGDIDQYFESPRALPPTSSSNSCLSYTTASMDSPQSGSRSVSPFTPSPSHSPKSINPSSMTVTPSSSVNPTAAATPIPTTALLSGIAHFTHTPQKRKCKRHPHIDENRCCLSCGTHITPEWRKGPLGPKTLCNACGILYAKASKSSKSSPASTSASTPTPTPKGTKRKQPHPDK